MHGSFEQTGQSGADAWPQLRWEDWRDTCATLHLWTQLVGKVRLALAPPVNHWWHVPLYLTSRGLTTSPIPYQDRTFDVGFDFLADRLTIDVSDGARVAIPLRPLAVRDFRLELLGALAGLGIRVDVWRMPVELPDPIPFDEDVVHASYDPEPVRRFWRILLRTAAVLQGLRGRFLGKASPIHFFWGSFDLALTFFDGERAPERPGADAIQREAYSHRVVSFGFWPGSDAFPKAAFYAYAAPVPPGLDAARIAPGAAYWHPQLGEFLLEYEAARAAREPALAVRTFFESAYEAAASAAGWDRDRLERAAHH